MMMLTITTAVGLLTWRLDLLVHQNDVRHFSLGSHFDFHGAFCC